MSIFDNIKGRVQQEMAQREQQRAYIKNHKGTEAICTYIADMFDKGNSGYYWLKDNKTPLYPIVEESRVKLCYMQTGDGQSLKGVIPKNIPVATISFQEMYEWYGLSNGEGYRILDNKFQMKTLEDLISFEVQKLSHIRYNGGFLVKMFC